MKEYQSLKHFNTFGFEARAHYFSTCESIETLQKTLATEVAIVHPVFILGGGSNILLTGDYEGLVIKMNILGKELVSEDEHSVVIRAGAGENWHDLVLYTLSNNWGGLENLSLIPGTVGAAPMQNIGAYGMEIRNVFERLTAVHRETGAIKHFTAEECEFGYRESIFKKGLKDQYVICDVSFRLRKPPHALDISYGAIRDTLDSRNIKAPTIRDVSDAVIAIRQSKLPDPAKIGNSGSFFKNPTIDRTTFEQLRTQYPELPGYPAGEDQVKVPAGWLIEQCGWKGYEKNGVGVHRNQALVLVNYGTGTGRDVLELSRQIQNSVAEKFGVALQPEVNLI